MAQTTGVEKTGKNNSFLLSMALAILSGILLTLSFPDFDLWWLAWVALVPFLYGIYAGRNSAFSSICGGWLFGAIFIYGTCWWLAYAPIHYAGFPPALAYFIMIFVALGIGVFFAFFSFIQGRLFRRYGARAALLAPVIWVGVEYFRCLLTGNAWNAIGYSQAFVPVIIQPAKYGSFYLVGFLLVVFNSAIFLLLMDRSKYAMGLAAVILLSTFGLIFFSQPIKSANIPDAHKPEAEVVAIQPNVPMSGLNLTEWQRLRAEQGAMAERALAAATITGAAITGAPASASAPASGAGFPKIVVLPESPMNYAYEEDPEFRDFLRAYARKNNVSVLFNSAEPAHGTKQYYNSAVMVNELGARVAQYNKIHLMPFGEYVPMGDALSQVMPPLLGNFAFGEQTNLMPFGEAKGGIMICFESHFPSLSREFVRSGADVLVEITNDGYLGPTPVLKQHLANAVFRAVETNRPLLRVTNVGISGYIRPDGKILDETKSYVPDSRVWTVSRSDGSQTVYVMFGDWFAILCATLSLVYVVLSFRRGRNATIMERVL